MRLAVTRKKALEPRYNESALLFDPKVITDPAANSSRNEPARASRSSTTKSVTSVALGDTTPAAKTMAAAHKAIDALSGEDRATLVLFSRNAEENVRATTTGRPRLPVHRG